jgi:transposase
MNYFAGLDVSLEKTHICVLDRDGMVAFEASAASSPAAISDALKAAPTCMRVVFETGRMAPMLYHGLAELGVPVVCIESRQAYQALKTLTTHKTDRNDARGLAQLARTGFFKPVHVKSLPAHAVRALIMARKNLVGQRITLENQIRGLAVVFGVRLPRGLNPAFVQQVIAMSDGISGLSSAMQGLVAARHAVLAAIVAIDADIKRLVLASGACRRLMTIPGVGPLTALAFTAAIDDPTRFRRSRDIGAYLGLVPRRYQSGEVDYTGSISKVGDQRVRTLLYEAANVMLTRFKGALKLKDWALAIAKRSNMRKARIALAWRLAIIMHAMLRHGTEFKPA